MNIRRNIVLTLLIIGTIAGYTSGIYSAVTRGDDDGRGCKSRHARAYTEARE
jgi:hypothetical protein